MSRSLLMVVWNSTVGSSVSSGIVRARADGRPRAAVDELHRRHREDVARHHPRGHRGRNRLRVLGFEVDLHEVRIAVGRRGDAVDHADQHAVVLDVGSLRQAVADVDQIGDHPDVRHRAGLST